MRPSTSFQARRELLARVASRYCEATHPEKTRILDEFVASTGYARKYAIKLLTKPPVGDLGLSSSGIRRPRERNYGPAVQQALVAAWSAANGICAKRLVPFLPELVATLERHGHLSLSPEVRQQLLAISPATVDRILRPLREQDRPRGRSTTRPGALLKHQIPIRTFTDWNEARPGFFEADLVAHCGTSSAGAFLNTLVLTDVATGWTECQPLLHRSQEAVLHALRRARQLLPFPVLGLDTDNGSEFLNGQLLDYCREQQITFTRGRAYKKNDQCFVEQKNGVVVRQFVGYDRFEGLRAYEQLTEVYRALRLYVNFFQPSMKLLSKQRDGAKVTRKYDAARTPCQRLLATGVLDAAEQERLEALHHSLDPVRLLRQLEQLQDALWQHTQFTGKVTPGNGVGDHRRFDPAVVRALLAEGQHPEERSSEFSASPPPSSEPQRKYRRSDKPRMPRTWRTRTDPFAAVWEEVQGWLMAEPELTAKLLFLRLQAKYADQYADGQLRTLQRRVKLWRKELLLTFDDTWMKEEPLHEAVQPGPLRARQASETPRAAA